MAKKNKKTDEDFLEDGLIREVNDDLRHDKLKEIWEKYGTYIIVLVVLLIGSTAVFEGYKSWKTSVENKEAQSFISAIAEIDEGKTEEGLKSFEDIANNARTEFKYLAKLQISNIYFKNGQTEEAIEKLKEIYSDKSVGKSLRNIAAIKLVSHTIDTADAESIRQILEPMVVEQNAFRYAAKEMLGLLEIREGNLEAAKTIFEELSSDSLVAAGIKQRAEEMLLLINK